MITFCYCPKHCFRLIEGQQSAGVGVKISWVKQYFEILPALGLEPLSPGMELGMLPLDQLDLHFRTKHSTVLMLC